MKRRTKWIAGIAFAVAALAIVTVVLLNSLPPKITVVKPTCLEKGYTVYVRNGKTQIKDVVDATGHSFSAWEVEQAPSGVAGGVRTRICQTCQWKQTDVFHEQNALPQIYLNGDISAISKTAQAQVTARFSMADIDFDGYALIKYQGHESLKYEKKNFTIKFFSDEQCNEKETFQFSHWNKENKYILKANYTDTSRSRNLICADLWSQMAASRQTIEPRLQETSNLGAVDGFPVELYLNDSFLGIYNLTLHKDDDLFAMKDGQMDGIVIINECDTQAAFFRESIDWSTSPDWEVEYCGTEDADWLKDKTDRFLHFVMNSTDESFRKELPVYADVESLIDYMIAMYALGLPTHAAQDLILATYEEGAFIASLFDMENAFGMVSDGTGFEAADQGLPIEKNGQLTSGTGSLLWDRLIANFYPQIRGRYTALREEILSEQNIFAVAEAKIGAIPTAVNQADLDLYPGQPQQDTAHLEQIKTYTTERLSLLDAIFADSSEEGPNNEG